MNPILFPENQTDFTTNGLGRLPDAISCTVTEERNGEYELHMEYPIDGQNVNEITYNRIILATAADNKASQPFRIYRITKPLSGIIEIDAEHISYQMSHIPIMPFAVEGMTPAFQAFTTYAAETNPFIFSREGGFGDVITKGFKVVAPDNLRSLLFGQEGSVIDTYGGEWEFDRFNVILHYARGSDKGVTIRYGKNLTDLKQEENIESTYTGICPFWRGQEEDGTEAVVTLPEKVLHSTFSSNYPYQRTKIVDFSSEFQSKPTVLELRAKGQDYIENNDVGTPKVSLDASFVALHQTQEYTDITKVEHINLCDTVTVVFPTLNISTKAKVVKTVWDVLLDRYDSITIGAIQGRLSATLQENQENAIEQAVQKSASAASTEYATKATTDAISYVLGNIDQRVFAVEDTINAYTGKNGGYVYLTIDANEQVDELLILVDSPVLNAAQKVFRFNESGLCYTSGGYEHGSWSVIVAPNGQINAAALYNTISDLAGKNSWNLTTGAMTLSSDVTFGGKTIATLVGELMPDVSSALQTALTAALNAFDAGLNQNKILQKLTAGTDPSNDEPITDTGFYLGSDGLLHMLPERVITDGANVPICLIPNTIVNGVVTSFTQVRVVNGIIYPPISYTVTYYDEDGETALGTESVIAGGNCSSIPNLPEKTGFTFSGWSDTVGGTVDATLLENILADKSLYAVFEETEPEEPEPTSE